MSSGPTLIYLHGVGKGDPSGAWKDVLSTALEQVGYPTLEGVRVIAPKYPHTLRYPGDDKETLPPIRVGPPSGDQSKRFRRDFERRTAHLESLLSRHDEGSGWALGEAFIELGLESNLLPQANRYLGDEQTRARTLNRVLKAVPKTGQIVVVGYSLGSIIALDLLRRLPEAVKVTGLVTIGSPIAHRSFHVGRLKDSLAKPPANLEWWVNFWSDGDAVTAHKGASSVFPWVLDQRLRLSWAAHNADKYLATASVATAIGYAVFGSRSKELVKADGGLDVTLNQLEVRVLLALKYAHFVRDQLTGDRRDRYEGALRSAQLTVVETILAKYEEIGTRVPQAIADLAIDGARPDRPIPTPVSISSLTKSDAVVLLLSIAATNVIQPFEIEVSKEKSKRALEDLGVDMGLGSQFGANANWAYREAVATLKDGGADWVDWLLVGVGAALLVGATGGLVLAAAPGLVGGAAIVSSLAAFGPGGMIGGLLTAGAMVSAGSGSVAVALASPGTPAQTVEAVVSLELAGAILRKKEGLDQNLQTRPSLVQTAIEIRREQARFSPFSDEGSPSLKALGKKLKVVERAISYIDKHALHSSPGGDDPTT